MWRMEQYFPFRWTNPSQVIRFQVSCENTKSNGGLFYPCLQLTANSTAAQICLRHYIKLIWESTTTEDKNLHRHLRSFQFIQNSNEMASRLTATTSFPRVLFRLLQFSRQGQSFSAHRAAPMTKTDLIFPAFSSRFVDFAVQFCFCCKFFPRDARLESGLTVA